MPSNLPFLIVGALACLALLLMSLRLGLVTRLVRAPRIVRRRVTWTDHGPTPLGEKRYTPQGLTWAEGRLLFANSWKDKRSRVYEFDPATMQELRTFDMPPEAVHTSGLAWDGEYLWGVDHKSNLAYCLDRDASFASGQAHVVGKFSTGFLGTSACCLVPVDGEICMAISDYLRTCSTIIVRHKAALIDGSASAHIVFRYRNEGCSQGLEFANGFLWESENKLGRDVINQLDLDRLRQTGNARRSTIAQISGPGAGIEDLAFDGVRMWTSDEMSFRFYSAILE